LFVAVFFSNASLAECKKPGDLTNSIFNVIDGNEEPIGVAFLIDDVNRLFLTAQHVVYQQIENNKEVRLKREKQQIVTEIVLQGKKIGSANLFDDLMSDWALLKGQESQESDDSSEIPTPLTLYINEVNTNSLFNSGVYKSGGVLGTSKIELRSLNLPNLQAEPDEAAKYLGGCSPRDLKVLQVENYGKGDSGSPVITSDCTVAALTSRFTGNHKSDGIDRLWSEEHRKSFKEHSELLEKYEKLQKLEERQKNSSPPLSSDELDEMHRYQDIFGDPDTLNKMLVYKGILKNQMVRFVPVVCIMREIIEARFKDKIVFQFSNHRDKLEILQKDISKQPLSSFINTFDKVSRLEDLTWTDLVELQYALRKIPKELEMQRRELDAMLVVKEVTITKSAYIQMLSRMVRRNIRNQSNTAVLADPSLSSSSAKDIAKKLVDNANKAQSTLNKITLGTLPQIVPAESKKFDVGLPAEKIKLAKEMEKYLTDRIAWPVEATPDSKRTVADITLSYAASAYHAASAYLAAKKSATNDLKNREIVAESLETIGTVINYGSKEEVLGEARYKPEPDVGDIIHNKGREARTSSGSDNTENQLNRLFLRTLDTTSEKDIKEIAEKLVSKANETKITLETLHQKIVPAESRNIAKDLSPEEKTGVAKKLEGYLTGRTLWPVKVTTDSKRRYADMALSYAASAYLAAKESATNDLKNREIVAESLETIGTVINYGSKEEVLGEKRYIQRPNIGDIIHNKGREARTFSK